MEKIRWCPSPNCNYVVEKTSTIALLSYGCQCGETYCFECGDPAHEVITCEQLNTFKNHTDRETYQWIATNAKSCPNCKASIEKNGGCMHMVPFSQSSFIFHTFNHFSRTFIVSIVRHAAIAAMNFAGRVWVIGLAIRPVIDMKGKIRPKHFWHGSRIIAIATAIKLNR